MPLINAENSPVPSPMETTSSVFHMFVGKLGYMNQAQHQVLLQQRLQMAQSYDFPSTIEPGAYFSAASSQGSAEAALSQEKLFLLLCLLPAHKHQFPVPHWYIGRVFYTSPGNLGYVQETVTPPKSTKAPKSVMRLTIPWRVWPSSRLSRFHSAWPYSSSRITFCERTILFFAPVKFNARRSSVSDIGLGQQHNSFHQGSRKSTDTYVNQKTAFNNFNYFSFQFGSILKSFLQLFPGFSRSARF